MTGRVLFLFILFSCLACGADNEKPAATGPANLPPQYYYYPRANVYFDSANKEYLFLAADQHSWQTAKQIPAVVKNLMDKGVLIEHPAQPVWQDNAKHKLVYSALLYATPSDTLEKKEAPRPVKKTGTASDNSKEKKERKGLGKFLDKIFGKKKKD